VPVEFLSDEEAARFGRYDGSPSRAELERAFFLDDADRALVGRRRGDHNRLGFALQLTTARYLGTFLSDPLDVPRAVVDYLSGQLEVADPSCVKRYTERAKTRFEHMWEIRGRYDLREFAEAEASLVAWVDARAWTTGDGPKAIFADAVLWLRERNVLLPGVTTLARLVARIRDEATLRLWDTLAALLSPQQRELLDALLVVPEGARVCDLERWRKGPTRTSGPAMVRALERISEIRAVGVGSLNLEGVPQRRLVELARYGMGAKSALLHRHSAPRRLATLVATVAYLESRATDDALELLDVLMATELVGRAEREADKEKLRRHFRLAVASAKLAAAVGVLDAIGGTEPVSLAEVWAAIEAVVPRDELRAAVGVIAELAPPLGTDDAGAWRAELSRRIVSVSGFLKVLTDVIDFGADAEAQAVLVAMRAMPALLDGRRRPTADDTDAGLVTGSWRGLVFGQPTYPAGGIDKNAYAFCVLTQFHRHLKRRGIYAPASTRWADPRAQLLDGLAWAKAKDAVLTTLRLPEDDPTDLLTGHAAALDEAYREVGDRLVAAGSDVSVDRDGRLHVASLKAVPEPPSLTELRTRVAAMLPRIDLPEVVLEVMGWEPRFIGAFTARSGGGPRMADLDISVAACLSAQAMNIGYPPVARKGVVALAPDRLSHVAQTYFGADNVGAANAPLISRQARIAFAHALGGGLVAAVDGMRFVVPVPSVYARPNRKYFGAKKGVTWLNMMNDQAAGLAAKVVSGTVRDSLHVIDVLYSQDGGQRPDIVVTDTGSYSDLVFGLLQLLGFEYRPALADIPDQRLWRGDHQASYGPLDVTSRGKLDLDKITRHWPDIVRVVGSIHTGAVRAYDVVRMLQARRPPHPARRGDRPLRTDLQVTPHPRLHRRRGLPARHQGHPQPPRGPPRPGAEDLPRPQRRALPALPRRAPATARTRRLQGTRQRPRARLAALRAQRSSEKSSTIIVSAAARRIGKSS